MLKLLRWGTQAPRTSVDIYQLTRRHNPDDMIHHLQTYNSG